MSDRDDLSGQRFVWLRSGFDIEGWVGALAAWLAALLLGFVWGPLFWIGFVCAVLILLATRTAERTVPSVEDMMIAPCDGTVVSVGGASLPNALRLEGSGWRRIRISSAPVTSNGVYAPMGGEIDHIIREDGDPAAVLAMRPDAPGLSVAYLAFEGSGRSAGVRLAAGGFGPRLEVDVESGDAVRLGRHIGTRRLGGWCDVYVPSGAAITVEPGQTLIGAETVIARFSGAAEPVVPPVEQEVEIVPEAEPQPLPVVDLDEGDEEALEALAETAEETRSEADDDAGTATDEAGSDKAEDAAPEDEDDVSEMFAKLRKEAQKVRDEGGE